MNRKPESEINFNTFMAKTKFVGFCSLFFLYSRCYESCEVDIYTCNLVYSSEHSEKISR